MHRELQPAAVIACTDVCRRTSAGPRTARQMIPIRKSLITAVAPSTMVSAAWPVCADLTWMLVRCKRKAMPGTSPALDHGGLQLPVVLDEPVL